MLNKSKKVIVILLCTIFLMVVFYKIFWFFQLRDLPCSVKLPLKKVVEAYYLTKITGGYWENQFETQAGIIADLPQNDRVNFFRGVILLTCDLDTSRATTFIHRVGNDAKALLEDLINLKRRETFHNLSEKQQKEALDWIGELNIIVEQQSQRQLQIK